MNLLDTALIKTIRIYQNYISPYKGFRCAHGLLFGGDSCSSAVCKIIRRRGFFAGYPHIKQQFARCQNAYSQFQQLSSETQQKNKKKNKNKRSKRECAEHLTCEGLANCIPNILCKGDKSGGCDLPCDCNPSFRLD